MRVKFLDENSVHDNSIDDLRQRATNAFNAVVSRLREKLPHAAEEVYLQKNLVARVDGMPSWWGDGNNVLVAHSGVNVATLSYIGSSPPRNAIVIIADDCDLPGQLILSGNGAFVFLGPHSKFPNGVIICGEQASVVLAGSVFSISSATLDARNGGIIYVGEDNLWSSNVKITTDDMHAVFDLNNRTRINRYGSVVSIGTHVWIGLDCIINPGVNIADNVVVGSRSVVTKSIATGCLVAGSPARVIKTDVTWTREDTHPKFPLGDFGFPSSKSRFKDRSKIFHFISLFSALWVWMSSIFRRS